MHARRLDRNIVWVLVGGFSLTILLLLGAGYSGMQARDVIEQSHVSLRERHRLITRVIDEIQNEEAGLPIFFFSLVGSPAPPGEAVLRARLVGIERDVRVTLAAARASSGPEPWMGVTASTERFITEVRRVLADPSIRPGRDGRLFRAHEDLVTSLSALVSDADARMGDESRRDQQHGEARVARAGALLAVGVLAAIACAFATVAIALHMFRRTEWQARELARLSAHVLETQEQILQRFSHELHDELGQTLTAIEANLAALPASTPDAALRKEDSVLLVKDAICTVRELSQLFRPSTLDDFGLASSLQWLAESFAQRTQIAVEPKLAFDGRLQGDVETHLFRIAQEALTNVARHSGATSAIVTLLEDNGRLRLLVADNGRGLPAGLPAGKSSARSGFGLIGMRERMRAAGGLLRVTSGAAAAATNSSGTGNNGSGSGGQAIVYRGVTVIAEVPLHAVQPT
jgi:two-component system sensor histidine kinase UhpB